MYSVVLAVVDTSDSELRDVRGVEVFDVERVDADEDDCSVEENAKVCVDFSVVAIVTIVSIGLPVTFVSPSVELNSVVDSEVTDLSVLGLTEGCCVFSSVPSEVSKDRSVVSFDVGDTEFELNPVVEIEAKVSSV